MMNNKKVSGKEEMQTTPKKSRRKKSACLWYICMVAIGIIVGLFVIKTLESLRSPYQKDLSTLKAPIWIEQDFIPENPYSRPGIKIQRINDVVIHYVANPGTSAMQNRNYFEKLSEQSGNDATYASSHFIVGIDGRILQCIPMDEKAYASNNRNNDTVAIEFCHPDDTGEPSEATYQSLVKLTAWICKELNLSEKHIIRHYDVTGKECPLFYVQNEAEWKQFKKDVGKAIKLVSETS